MLPYLDPHQPSQNFPSLSEALTDPDGLLAAGGCLSSTRLLSAYRNGIFPWYSEDDPILWWSPDPRLVIFPNQLHISKSLQKTIRKQPFTLSFDKAFADVIAACSNPRADGLGTWLSPEMQNAYIQLHQQGHAHSIEAWADNQLVGGLYGIAIGRVFFGESMFHTQTDASKIAFVTLIQQLTEWGYQLIDCQVHSDHLVSLGAEEIPRTHFISLLKQHRDNAPNQQAWQI
ncbi:MAG: leucyl/phenylalanyl-tRNA--protein transferase [Methyloprofundus sp.]|nr:leucyl/phenylalanyl-tRNA--protein transferase [Methyloprofundus sp.]